MRSIGDFAFGPKVKDPYWRLLLFDELPSARRHRIVGNHDGAQAQARPFTPRGRRPLLIVHDMPLHDDDMESRRSAIIKAQVTAAAPLSATPMAKRLTCGCRRIAAILDRQPRSDGQVPDNHKRVGQSTQTHILRIDRAAGACAGRQGHRHPLEPELVSGRVRSQLQERREYLQRWTPVRDADCPAGRAWQWRSMDPGRACGGTRELTARVSRR